ncbi:DHS-like NAD/FAD-binding domain-containing protein [Clavulina sp. PMI_390]|nr:DHS-like NAD/FAD-binding domain-containing protein [Clavulina sp. PMI_390]
MSDKKERDFREVLRKSKNIIAVCGAGLSAASGIPTFRGAGGLWRNFDAIKIATPAAFDANPSLVWQFYHYRRESALKAKPNPAHHALAWLSVPSNRLSIAPNSASFNIITQNVDGLSLRAASSLPSADQEEALSVITQMHGNIHVTRCTECRRSRQDFSSPICEGLRGTEARFNQALGPEDEIPRERLPHCTAEGCGGMLRPGVVWFGESIPKLKDIEKLVAQADLCLVIGTSSTVQPAASFAGDVQENGGTVAVFNLDRSEGDDEADFLFLGPCEETLPRIIGTKSTSSGDEAGASNSS